ncbi:hypothetical protein AWN90_40905 [Nocardia terpenica]|uniref:Uncharacterized protein n=1 Tax=Nocardia terpenica TaxID=455432 RepID=A0A161XCE8_9NOCA|nr:hypothetical protein AWN90_40905 [Nocardia terpenica]
MQETLGLGVEDFAARVEVTPSIIYRWRRDGPDAQLRKSNQRRLATLVAQLDDEQQQRFWDLRAMEWERWHSPSGLLITSNLAPTVLAGHWVTCFTFGQDRRHADIAEVTVHAGQLVAARNYPPEPRSERRRTGFRHHIEAELIDRQLIGRWRNISDSYYFGGLHLTVLPGEAVLTGVYTGNAHDGRIVAQQWKWVRLDDQSLHDVELPEIALQDPTLIYARVDQHTYGDGPIRLGDVVEATQ